MKTIGILLRDSDENKVVSKELIDYIKCFDVNIIGIIMDDNTDFNKVIYNVNICDGIILPGGNRINNIDLKLIKYLWQIDKPVLGICLGMQEMALAFNGKIEKLENDFHNSNLNYVHKVHIKNNTFLKSIFDSNKIMVNSRHNYYVKETNLSISAYSDDYVIEAIEDKSKRYFLGIQWHPESLSKDIHSRLIIDDFINSI